MGAREESDVIGDFISRLLKQASLVMGDLSIERDDWWIEFRPSWPDVIRLRYLTPQREKRLWVDWRIPLNSIFMLEHKGQTDAFIQHQLREFKARVRRSDAATRSGSGEPDAVH